MVVVYSSTVIQATGNITTQGQEEFLQESAVRQELPESSLPVPLLGNPLHELPISLPLPLLGSPLQQR